MSICQVLKVNNRVSLYLVLLIEVLIVILASMGIVEREAVLIMSGLMVFYFIFSKVEDSLILFILSIPLFAALSIGDFDSMANWRILLAILFLVWFFKKIKEKPISSVIRNIVPGLLKSRLAVFVGIFLLIGLLSLFAATDVVVGIKKILFLVNIFLLFPIIIDIAKDKNQRLGIIKSGAIAGIVSLIVGYSQLIFVFLKPLYTFWQWWARNVISVFYGTNLSELLAKSNTWFSYYADSPPTLRMFSVFPDSHSFALFVIISLIFFSYLLLRNKKLWFIIVLSFLALVFSGSRAVWISAAIPFLAALYLLIFKKQKVFKQCIVMLIIFALAFPVSSLILSKSYQGGGDSTLAFKRAKTIADLEELSVKSRMGIWNTSFQSILKHPILGVGIGNYPVVLDEEISAAKKGASAHNLYLDVASEMGLLGLIVLLLIFWQIFKKSLRQPVFAFFILWILIYNLFDVVLLNDKVLLLFMVALATLYSVRNHE
jgi:O-antigen ligase